MLVHENLMVCYSLTTSVSECINAVLFISTAQTIPRFAELLCEYSLSAANDQNVDHSSHDVLAPAFIVAGLLPTMGASAIVSNKLQLFVNVAEEPMHPRTNISSSTSTSTTSSGGIGSGGLKYSIRFEFEVTDVNKLYHEQNQFPVSILDRYCVRKYIHKYYLYNWTPRALPPCRDVSQTCRLLAKSRLPTTKIVSMLLQSNSGTDCGVSILAENMYLFLKFLGVNDGISYRRKFRIHGFQETWA